MTRSRATGGTTLADTVVGRWLAAGDRDAPALLASGEQCTYAELIERVDARSAELDLPDRQVVILTGERSLEYVVTYLAILNAGHVPLLAAAHAERLADAWRPGAVVHADATGWAITERRADAETALHPDLALLLSTSGSTGSPKLVRLSRANLESNAVAIAESLGLSATDRAITALPLHYCYGLSVLHSHLAVGASVVVEASSVVDPCFAAALSRYGVTNVAAVPYTLDLLESAGPERIHVPSLRLVTHAGGRLAPDAAVRWLGRTAGWGVDFVSMYGQTEATARIAYLPSELARAHPGTLGLPVPGGELTIEPISDGPVGDVADGAGEIVYRGPNVMMGYAETADDLSRGAELDRLRTGDLGLRDPDTGLIRIVGRKARFVKPFGVRIDLDQVERELRAAGHGGAGELAVAGDDQALVVAGPSLDASRVRAAVATFTGLPEHRVGVLLDLPRTRTGKPDYAAALERGRPSADQPDGGVASVFATVLGVDRVRPGDSFVVLGGDSLSYVEAAARLEPLIGRLPADWHFMPVGELETLAVDRGPRRRVIQWTDTTAVLRAVGICAVVLTHMRWAFFPGGAHVMLAVVAYNLSRFLLPVDRTRDRLRLGARTVARVAVPTVVWVAIGMLAFGAYSTGTLLLVNNYVGPPGHRDDHWHFWFVEVFVHLIAIMLAAYAIPAVRRFDRRRPYLLPLGLVGVGVLLRQEWAQMDDWYNLRFRTHGVVLFFALGWLIHRSTTVRLRLISSIIVIAGVADTFNFLQREVFIGAGLLALLWWRQLPLPRPLGHVVAVVASASMWILITHFTVYPWMMDRMAIEWAYFATLATGIAAWWVFDRAERLLVPGVSVA